MLLKNENPQPVATELGASGIRCVGKSKNTRSVSQKQPALHNLRVQRDVEHLHRLGARLLFELFLELGDDLLIRSEIEAKVGRYAQLDPAVVHALGGDLFPPRPLHEVRR